MSGGATSTNGQLTDEGLETVAALVGARLGDQLDYEAVNPAEALAGGAGRIYLSHAPTGITLTGLRVNVAGKGTGTVTVMVYAAGLEMLTGPVTLTAESNLIPLSLVKPERRTLAGGQRLDVRVISAPGGYGAQWRGLRVAFLGRVKMAPGEVPTPEDVEDLARVVHWVMQVMPIPLKTPGGAFLTKNGKILMKRRKNLKDFKF